ncbi:MAG: M64 family metallopeptidase [Candidatus Zixiibacteriota bacterium]
MHKRLFWLSAVIAVFALANPGNAAQSEQYWQLVFRYTSSDLQLVKADPIAQIEKEIRTPGLESAAIRVGYRCEWLDNAGRPVFVSSTEMPVGIRVPLGDSLPCQWLVPEEGIIVVRTTGPDPKANSESIRLTQTGIVNRARPAISLPAPFLQTEVSVSVASATRTAALAPGPVGVQKIRDTGPDANRLVMVIMGDGYTAADLSGGAFSGAAASLGAAFESKPPWDVLFAATNLYRIDIESNEQGADHEVFGVLKDTYLNSSFWINGIERLLSLTGDGYFKAIQASDNLVGPGVWDLILVLVNSTKYGGSGGGIAVSSVHSAAAEIVIHEVGHTFANLADEYETAYPGYPPGDSEPNVDFDYDGPGLKWLIWVEPGTPLPTPESSPYLTTVGTFEGARYLSSGIYRPWYNCEMRSLNRPFCPICQEAHVLDFTGMVSLTDLVAPPVGTNQNIDEGGTLFAVTPIPLSDLEYEWFLDGVPIPAGVGPSLSLTPDMMAEHNQTLQLNIVLNTPLVRKTTVTRSYLWPVTTEVSLCCTGVVGDANYDGAYDPTIGDITAIIDHLFVSGTPLACYEEADVNQSGGTSPGSTDITIGDITILIDNLFITGVTLPACF